MRIVFGGLPTSQIWEIPNKEKGIPIPENDKLSKLRSKFGVEPNSHSWDHLLYESHIPSFESLVVS